MAYYVVIPTFTQVPGDIIINSYPGYVLIKTERAVDPVQIIKDIDPDELYNIYITELQNEVKTQLMEFCDNKQVEAMKAILGYKATTMQIERYKDKYERAMAGEWDNDTNQAIINNYTTYRDNLRTLIDKIELFRMKTDDLIIANRIEDAKNALVMARELPLTASADEILNIFTILDNNEDDA